MERLREWFDIPPVWLAGFALLAWVQGRHFPMSLSLAGGLTSFVAGVMIGAGLLVFVLALLEFRRHQTTVHPHHQPSALITTGIYRRTRNPIYLADLLLLCGLILRWDAVLSLPLVPILLWTLEKRFIIAEENRLRRSFRADFARYCQKTRRWL